jgi:hypothetical protein
MSRLASSCTLFLARRLETVSREKNATNAVRQHWTVLVDAMKYGRGLGLQEANPASVLNGRGLLGIGNSRQAERRPIWAGDRYLLMPYKHGSPANITQI